MKNNTFYTRIAVLLALLNIVSLGIAAPLGNSNLPLDYAIAVKDLSAFGIGTYIEVIKRDVEIDGVSEVTLKSERAMLYASWSAFPWLNTYVAGGSSRHKFGEYTSYSDESFEWGAGFRVNLLDNDILAPTLMEDNIRINAGLHYANVSVDGNGSPDWSELTGSLTLSIVNDVRGNKFFLPNTIALYAGPIYSAIYGDDVDEEDSFGYTVGMEVHLNEKLSCDIGVQNISDVSLVAGLHLVL